MHNRARMLVASYLTKHLMSHWKIGMDWFEDCLVDWDPASNAMGWQWSAGSGPDATPYFRVFNPETQAEKFDAHGRYRRKWVAELSSPRPRRRLAISRRSRAAGGWGQATPTRPAGGRRGHGAEARAGGL
jgi:deoxyribodipyrimidine photo-lyase